MCASRPFPVSTRLALARFSGQFYHQSQFRWGGKPARVTVPMAWLHSPRAMSGVPCFPPPLPWESESLPVQIPGHFPVSRPLTVTCKSVVPFSNTVLSCIFRNKLYTKAFSYQEQNIHHIGKIQIVNRLGSTSQISAEGSGVLKY